MSLPENIKVFHLPWKSGSSIKNSLTILKTLYPFILKNRDAVVFSHMTDVHTALVSPLTWALKMRHVIWYAHAVTSKYLFFSSFFVSTIVSSTPGSCRLRVNRRKIRFIDQGIDPDDFPFYCRQFLQRRRILYYGRLDRSKKIDLFCELMDTLKSSSTVFTLDVFGESSNMYSEQFMEGVKKTILDKSLQNVFRIFGPLERRQIHLVARDYDIFLNLFIGSLDKTLIEATFMGLPVVTWNREYCSQFGTWSNFPVDSSLEFIASELRYLISQPIDKLQPEIDRRRREAVNRHSFDGWIERLNAVLAGE